MTTPVPPAWRLWLASIFAQVEQEGYGIALGDSFEAYPGMEDAAADRIEHLTQEVAR